MNKCHLTLNFCLGIKARNNCITREYSETQEIREENKKKSDYQANLEREFRDEILVSEALQLELNESKERELELEELKPGNGSELLLLLLK